MANKPDMMWPAIGAQIFSTVLNAGGAFQRGNSNLAIGQRKAALGGFQADQLDQQAGESIAAGQYRAAEERRKGKYLESTALARAAASGGGASDPTVMRIMSDIDAESAYRQAMAMYGANSQARAMTMAADAARFQGDTALEDAKVAKRYADITGVSTLLSGAAKTMFSKYNIGSD